MVSALPSGCRDSAPTGGTERQSGIRRDATAAAFPSVSRDFSAKTASTLGFLEMAIVEFDSRQLHRITKAF
jgi:hypothetical protein